VTAAEAAPTFKATYRGESGLNCVDLGYCYRPTRKFTTVVISMSTGDATITVPAGLPTGALPTATPVAPSTSEPIIEFTQDKKKRAIEVPRTVMAA
jgi:hypothetical protein